jgi:hypothetical protein
MDTGDTDGRDELVEILNFVPVVILALIVPTGLMTLRCSSDIMISSEE